MGIVWGIGAVASIILGAIGRKARELGQPVTVPMVAWIGGIATIVLDVVVGFFLPPTYGGSRKGGTRRRTSHRPVILGAGTPLFAGIRAPVHLEETKVAETSHARHVTYRVIPSRSAPAA